jgi:hypothetical protein
MLKINMSLNKMDQTWTNTLKCTAHMDTKSLRQRVISVFSFAIEENSTHARLRNALNIMHSAIFAINIVCVYT